VEVHLVTATRGQAGSCGEPPLCTPGELPTVREAELRCACRALGLQPPRVLDFDDGHLAEVDGKILVRMILSILVALEPQVLFSFGPDGLSGHPDHVAVGHAAWRAHAKWPGLAAYYTVAVPGSVSSRLGLAQVQSIPDEAIALSVDVGATWESRQAAMACHDTQRSTTPWLHADPESQRAFFGCEYFSRPNARRPEEDFVPSLLKEHLL
jgi:LmbE family N-acetylglucosaminyl deacetylase